MLRTYPFLPLQYSHVPCFVLPPCHILPLHCAAFNYLNYAALSSIPAVPSRFQRSVPLHSCLCKTLRYPPEQYRILRDSPVFTFRSLTIISIPRLSCPSHTLESGTAFSLCCHYPYFTIQDILTYPFQPHRYCAKQSSEGLDVIVLPILCNTPLYNELHSTPTLSCPYSADLYRPMLFTPFLPSRFIKVYCSTKRCPTLLPIPSS